MFAFLLLKSDCALELVASGDHRFLTSQGWRYVIAPGRNKRARLHLQEKDACLGPGKSRLKAKGLFKSSPREVASSVAGGVAAVETRIEKIALGPDGQPSGTQPFDAG